MNSQRLLSSQILILITMALSFGAPARAREGHFERTCQVSGAVELDVQTGSGTIDVRTVSGDIRVG